jgi:hypothetical protein
MIQFALRLRGRVVEIRSSEEHDRAVADLDALDDRRDGWTADDEAYFVELALAVERYEDAIYGAVADSE